MSGIVPAHRLSAATLSISAIFTANGFEDSYRETAAAMIAGAGMTPILLYSPKTAS
ncbi:hypothetical protein PtrV1_09628 [Pyrenophora tritici-repentis]|uniref:Uncharacterized protein n=1 Tax=Pyrenophora tritici-repentis TaxID=45151 RepID=A0A5M9KZ93_9PLEO|nr:hypothetical protein PtrV1_09628 [Pyrenophora tritici-repentis]KAF7568622.1 hypothetical protein PtrM4_132350 [Pyrenophora tritici-repentis]KAI0573288.1 hypothetical protein Alg215_09279 [Pyrenophora tritici-repentis]